MAKIRISEKTGLIIAKLQVKRKCYNWAEFWLVYIEVYIISISCWNMTITYCCYKKYSDNKIVLPWCAYLVYSRSMLEYVYYNNLQAGEFEVRFASFYEAISIPEPKIKYFVSQIWKCYFFPENSDDNRSRYGWH